MSKVSIFIDPTANGVNAAQNAIPFDFKVEEIYFFTSVPADQVPDPNNVFDLSMTVTMSADWQGNTTPEDTSITLKQSVKAVPISGDGALAGFKFELRKEVGFIIKGGEAVFLIAAGIPAYTLVQGLWFKGEYL